MNKFFLRLSLQEQILFAKRLGILIKADIPVLEALQMLKDQASSRSSSHIFEKLIGDVANGQFLSSSLAQFRHVFGEFAVNLVRVGESSGMLQENLDYLAQELNKRQQLRRKILAALVYPVFILVGTLGITSLLLFYVFPKILPIFKSLKFQLPWTTQVLIGGSEFLLRHATLTGVSLIVLGVLAFLLLKIRIVSFWVDRLILTLPFLGKIVKNYHLANFCRTLGLLLKSDLTVVEGSLITAQTTTNLVYQKEFGVMAHNLSQGKKLSHSLRERERLFPSVLVQMVAVGETSGNLSDTLLYLAELYEGEVEELAKNLSNLLEPTLMVFMGLIVGFVAISIITPIYELTQSLRP